MNIYVINLISAKDRRRHQEVQLRALELPYVIFNAVTPDQVSSTAPPNVRWDRWVRPVSNSERACFLSHFSLWKKIANNSSPALILEDDAVLSKRLPSTLKLLEQLHNIDHINLETTGRKKFLSTGTSIQDDLYLKRLYLDRSGAGGYILWPSGARKLLQKLDKDGPALTDAFINSTVSLRSYQISPALTIQPCISSLFNYVATLRIDTQISKEMLSDSTLGGKEFFRYKVRRIFHELKLGFRILLILHKSKRELTPPDHSYLP
jgi:glycosyl transferase family 25